MSPPGGPKVENVASGNSPENDSGQLASSSKKGIAAAAFRAAQATYGLATGTSGTGQASASTGGQSTQELLAAAGLQKRSADKGNSQREASGSLASQQGEQSQAQAPASLPAHAADKSGHSSQKRPSSRVGSKGGQSSQERPSHKASSNQARPLGQPHQDQRPADHKGTPKNSPENDSG